MLLFKILGLGNVAASCRSAGLLVMVLWEGPVGPYMEAVPHAEIAGEVQVAVAVVAGSGDSGTPGAVDGSVGSGYLLP